MGLIPCSEECKFQNDGYCFLEKCSCVNSTHKNCPYFVDALFDDSDSLAKTSDTYKF